MDNKVFDELKDEELLAVCMYGEARNQGLDGMLAVGSVIVNRAKHPSWWGTDIKSVILKPMQFSCLNENDPNRKTLEHIATDIPDSLMKLEVFKRCYWIAKGIMEGFLGSNVGKATHYHTRQVKPGWKDKLTKITQVGEHIFYV